MGGKMHNILSNPFAAMLQNKLHGFVTHFTVALSFWDRSRRSSEITYIGTCIGGEHRNNFQWQNDSNKTGKIKYK